MALTDLADILQRAGLALALGLLIGFQRERNKSRLAGIRTFPLIALFGFIAGHLSAPLGGWFVGFGTLALAAILIGGAWLESRSGNPGTGVTTEVSALLMYGIGAWLALSLTVTPAIAVAGTVALLLHLKDPLHGFVRQVGSSEARGIMQFVLIAMVILPVLPDENYGPYGVLNPFEIWLVVALITGISLFSYIALRYLTPNAGALWGGLLGGLVSSTATTVSYARRTRLGASTGLAALVVAIASTSAFIRIVMEVAVLTPRILPRVAPPLITMFVWMTLVCIAGYFYLRRKVGEEALVTTGSPTELRAALIFGALYAAVLLAAAAARDHFGPAGLYAVATVAGLTDVNAITISTAQMISREAVTAQVGWRAMMIAALSNICFKALLAGMLGDRRFAARIGVLFAIGVAGGFGIILFWPD